MSLKTSRHREILGRLNAQTDLRVNELAQELQVSPMTIRRDLQVLEDLGKVKRVFGGAVAVNAEADIEHPKARGMVQRHAKALIARHAAAFVSKGQHIFVGSGSTCQLFAREIAGHPGLRLYTNSITIAQELARFAQTDVSVFGGSFWRGANSLIGSETLQQIDKRRFDLVFIGVDAIDAARGLIEPTDWQASLAAHLRRSATRLIVLADDTKFKAAAGITALRLDEVDTLITSATPDVRLLEALAKAKVDLQKA